MEWQKVKGTLAEFKEAGLLELIRRDMRGEAEVETEGELNGEAPAFEPEVRQVLLKAPTADHRRVESYLANVLSWEGTRVGSVSPRYVRVETRFGPRRTLLYLVPSRPEANIYLDPAKAGEISLARHIPAKGWTPHQLSVPLTSDRALSEALRHARTAYEDLAGKR